MVNPALGLALIIDDIAKSGRYSVLNKIASFSAQTAPHAPPEKKQEGSNEFHDYHVVLNDSLPLIAKKFKTSVDAIKQDNKLKGDMIHPGMVLKIVYGKKTGSKGGATEEKDQKEKSLDNNTGDKKSEEKKEEKEEKSVMTQSSSNKPTDSFSEKGAQETSEATAKAKDSSSDSHSIPVTKHNAYKERQEKISLEMVTAIPDRGAVNYMGRPLALVEFPPKLAPWMKYAISEAEYWGGAEETEIVKDHEYKDSSGEIRTSKGINYHRASQSAKLDDMSGTLHAWCASFANYILEKANYRPVSSKLAMAKALSFSDDKINFVKIDKPVFGAIAVIKYPHVAFVFGWQQGSRGALLVCLGGNQGNTICFTRIPVGDVVGYYLPQAYYEAIKDDDHLKKMLDEKGAEQYMPDVDKYSLNLKYGIKEPVSRGTR